jgi:putative nucleotidyltransferase with HDIG domain
MQQSLTIDAMVRQVHQLAPLPAVALKVLELAHDDRSSAADLASVIATDQAMTAKLLRLANSAYFAAGRAITTVRDAVVVLGTIEVRRLVLTTALLGNFTGPSGGDFHLPSFWGHALAVGLVAEVMARLTGRATSEEAFTAGILHDIGKLVMSQYERERFEAATALATLKGMPLERAEAEVFGFSHPELGSRLALAWRFPPALCEAIAEHHASPHESRGLAWVVAQANALCRDHGLWCGFVDIEPGAAPPPDVPVRDPLRAAVLARLGGWERVLERTQAFLHAVPPPPGTRPGAAASTPGGTPAAPRADGSFDRAHRGGRW